MDSQRNMESLNAGRVAKSMEIAGPECDSVDVEGSNAYTRRACRLNHSGSGLIGLIVYLAYQPY